MSDTLHQAGVAAAIVIGFIFVALVVYAVFKLTTKVAKAGTEFVSKNTQLLQGASMLLL